MPIGRILKCPINCACLASKGKTGRWITLHPRALEAMGAPKPDGSIFDYWETLPAFREAVYIRKSASSAEFVGDWRGSAGRLTEESVKLTAGGIKGPLLLL
jgi:hypothetical protein